MNSNNVCIKRLYVQLIEQHIKTYRQMVFLAGARQVGKTTISQALKSLAGDNNYYYFNWDVKEHQKLILAGQVALANRLPNIHIAGAHIKIIVFDEIHKYSKWKSFLKGFFDLYEKKLKIIVTGSAKLDIYKRGGDSMMGRYFLYRIHPLSIAELVHSTISAQETRSPVYTEQATLIRLLAQGGFPEPYVENSVKFKQLWLHQRQAKLINEDIRDLTQIQEIRQVDLLSDLLVAQAGQLLNYSNLACIINVSAPTVKRWITSLESFYFCFLLKPWYKNVKRTLIKEPKVYLWDWSIVASPGARAENMVASHLLKAVHFWNDSGLGDYAVYFLRDKDKNEVDFLVTKNAHPWFLVEVKLSYNAGMSKSLYNFHRQLNTKHAFQVVFDLEYIDVDCFTYREPTMVPVTTFLSQLV